MTINDLRNSGIPLQGKTIRVSVWDGSDEPVQELFWEYELSGSCDRAFPKATRKRIDKIMEMEITSIYAVDGVLNIEVFNG